MSGLSTPSRDPNDPRHSRNAGAGVSTQQRFAQDKFFVNANGEMDMRLRIPRPTTKIETLTVIGEGAGADWGKIGYALGPVLNATGEDVAVYWTLPPDLNRAKPAEFHIRVAEVTGAGGGATLTLAVSFYAQKNGNNVSTSTADKTFSTVFTTDGTAGAERGESYTLEPPLFFVPDVKAVVFFGEGTLSSSDGQHVFYNCWVEYTPLYLHTHERVG